MRSLRQLFKLKKTAWSLIGGLMLIGLLGACTQVQVTVDTCPPGATRTSITSIPDAGACTNGPKLLVPADASGAYIANTTNPPQQIPLTDHSYTCNAGTWRCASNPGTCVFKPCWTKFTPDSPGAKTGACTCECQWK